MARTAQWQFYINTTTGDTKNLFKRTCKKPHRTQLWKEMQTWLTTQPFAEFEIKEVGYRIIE